MIDFNGVATNTGCKNGKILYARRVRCFMDVFIVRFEISKDGCVISVRPRHHSKFARA